MKQVFWICVLFAFAACTNDNQTPAAEGDTVHSNASDTILTNAEPVIISGCYEMINGKDTARMELVTKDTVVTGTLVFDWAEKDGNKGTLSGVLMDSLIVARYTFESEGMTSVRQEVFKVGDSVLIHGYGEVQEQNGKMVYTDKNNLTFDSSHAFKKADCP